MRMRKKKNGEARLAACAHLLCEKKTYGAQAAASVFDRSETRPLALEIGCGKGAFACGMAALHPEYTYLAIERVSDVMVAALERAVSCAEERPTDNLRFMIADAGDLESCFAEGSIAAIYLNFSDPWPKKGYYKRRLTYRAFLDVYFKLLAPGGVLCFKTDNRALFDFTLEELADTARTPEFVTYDLHRSPEAVGNVMTEYETNFTQKGISINALRVRKPL